MLLASRSYTSFVTGGESVNTRLWFGSNESSKSEASAEQVRFIIFLMEVYSTGRPSGSGWMTYRSKSIITAYLPPTIGNSVWA